LALLVYLGEEQAHMGIRTSTISGGTDESSPQRAALANVAGDAVDRFFCAECFFYGVLVHILQQRDRICRHDRTVGYPVSDAVATTAIRPAQFSPLVGKQSS